MKKFAFPSAPTLSFFLVVTLLAGAAVSTSAAPKTPVAPKTPPISTPMKPAKTPPLATPAAAKAAQNAAPATANQTTAAPAAAVEPAYQPSRFPGVSVRHIPAPSPPRSTAIRGHQGVITENMRPAPNPRNGFMADIVPNSYPDEMVQVRAAKKPIAPKAARKTVARPKAAKNRR